MAPRWDWVCAIYTITNINNGFIYVGSTCKPSTRIPAHFSSMASGRHYNSLMQNDYDNGCEFVVDVVDAISADYYGKVFLSLRAAGYYLERATLCKLKISGALTYNKYIPSDFLGNKHYECLSELYGRPDPDTVMSSSKLSTARKYAKALRLPASAVEIVE